MGPPEESGWGGHSNDQPCNVARPIALLGEGWTLLVLRQAFLGTRRFDDFQRSLGISRSLLTERLRKLVDAGILRQPYRDAVRTRDQYRLTEKGLDPYPALMALRAWSDKHEAPDEGPLVLLPPPRLRRAHRDRAPLRGLRRGVDRARRQPPAGARDGGRRSRNSVASRLSVSKITGSSR
jgi:DNA-binding HxlR family transcriptional regulator